MASTYVDDLVTYLEQFSPNARAAIRGAAPEQIAELEQLVGRPLPDQYRQYLERMGDVGISIASDGPDSRVANIIAYYRDMRASRQRGPDGYIIIAPGDHVSSIGLIDRAGQDPAVVLVGDRAMNQERPLAESLPKFLFRTVFTDGHSAAFPFAGFTNADASRGWPEHAHEAAADAGLVEQWFSEPTFACYQGDTAAAYVDQYQPGALDVRVWSQSQAEGERVGDVFRRRLRAQAIAIGPSYTYRP